jgi:hypothetical protein
MDNDEEISPMYIPTNEDKLDRCPRCHRIPDEVRKDGAALQGKAYSCPDCCVEHTTNARVWILSRVPD